MSTLWDGAHGQRVSYLTSLFLETDKKYQSRLSINAPAKMAPPLALEKGSLVLVTGANGYIASHIVDQTLASGYRVRGTVRDMSKADWMVELFSQRYGKGSFEPVVVKDMSADGAFHETMKGCAGVIHAASNVYAVNQTQLIIRC